MADGSAGRPGDRAGLAWEPVEDAVPDGHEFALCLTHDVDRPYKTYQSLYYAVADRDPAHLLDLLPGRNPYWQFETVMAVEDDLGVRSAFYLLDEQHLLRDRPVREWLRPAAWRRYLGRYRLDDPAIRAAVRALDAGGWEVGLHGSFGSYREPARLREEKAAVEAVLGDEVVGCRQHYLNLAVPATWRYQADAGLRYDASLGSSARVGFRHGYRPRRPFGDGFVAFPLTAMENALPDPGESFDRAWRTVRGLLAEARAAGAVASVLWHPRVFAEEFPGYRRLYRRLIEEALAMDAWVGPPADLYAALPDPAGRATSSDRRGATGRETTSRDGGTGPLPADEAGGSRHPPPGKGPADGP